MKDKGHFFISLAKSLLRILGSLLLSLGCLQYIKYGGFTNWDIMVHSVGTFATLFLVAELLGILEEVFDTR
jgi:hypothetical protein